MIAPCRWAGVLLLALAADKDPLCAEDPAPPGGNLPRFAAKDVVLAEPGLPEGWKLAPAEPPLPAEKALRDGIAAAATAAAEPDVVPITVALLTGEGKSVVVALVESQRDPAAFAEAARAAATKQGWAHRALGTPARLVLVAGPEGVREQALAAQTAFVVRILAERAAEALRKWREGDNRAAMRAYALSRSALQIDTRHAPSHVVMGDMILRMAANGRPDAKREDAVVHFRAALAKDATIPLVGDALVEAHGQLGSALLGLEPAQDAGARDALKAAVKGLAGSGVRRSAALRLRYNLACAHGRLKEKDEAFRILTALLDELAQAPDPQLSAHWRTNADFAGLREDPRWADLTRKYPEEKPEKQEAESGK